MVFLGCCWQDWGSLSQWHFIPALHSIQLWDRGDRSRQIAIGSKLSSGCFMPFRQIIFYFVLFFHCLFSIYYIPGYKLDIEHIKMKNLVPAQCVPVPVENTDTELCDYARRLMLWHIKRGFYSRVWTGSEMAAGEGAISGWVLKAEKAFTRQKRVKFF